MKKFLFCALFSMVSLDLRASDFLDIRTSCKNLKMEKASLRAECTANNGGVYITRIRLRGVSNKNGTLIFDGGSSALSKFHTSCQNIAIDSNAVLGAQCLNDAKKSQWTTLNLVDSILNYNGTLVYSLDK